MCPWESQTGGDIAKITNFDQTWHEYWQGFHKSGNCQGNKFFKLRGRGSNCAVIIIIDLLYYIREFVDSGFLTAKSLGFILDSEQKGLAKPAFIPSTLGSILDTLWKGK